MAQLPAVVTIPDLTAATAITTATLFEAAQTTNGVGEAVKVSLGQIMTTGFGILPVGGGTGQLLTKLSGADYSTQWSNIASAVLGTAGITTSGSTTVTVALAPATAALPLVGNGTASPPSYAVLTVPGGGIGTTALPSNGVVLGQGTSALTVVPAAATGLVLLSQGTGLAPIFTSAPPQAITIAGLSVFGVAGTASAAATAIVGTTDQVLRVAQGGTTLGFGAINLATSAAVTGVLALANGGWSTSTLTAFGVVFGNGTSKPGITAAGTTAWPLLGNGTSAAPSFQLLNLTASVTGNLALANLTSIGNSTVLGNVSGATATPIALSAVQLAGILPAPSVQIFTVAGGGVYTAVANVKFIIVRAFGAGGGGGGGAGATTSGSTGVAGGTTFFGTMTAPGGGGGQGGGQAGNLANGGAGGAAGTTGVGTVVFAGFPGVSSPASGANANAGMPGGGQGAGSGGNAGNVGSAGRAPGGGGGGGGSNVDSGGHSAGAGGGSGAYSESLLTSVLATAAFTVGAGGAGGAAGTGGTTPSAGGAGGPGYIIVYEFT